MTLFLTICCNSKSIVADTPLTGIVFSIQRVKEDETQVMVDNLYCKELKSMSEKKFLILMKVWFEEK